VEQMPLLMMGREWHKELLGRHFPLRLAQSEDTRLAQTPSRKGRTHGSTQPRGYCFGLHVGLRGTQSKALFHNMSLH
jgi:hypothetical protein